MKPISAQTEFEFKFVFTEIFNILLTNDSLVQKYSLFIVKRTIKNDFCLIIFSVIFLGFLFGIANADALQLIKRN